MMHLSSYIVAINSNVVSIQKKQFFHSQMFTEKGSNLKVRSEARPPISHLLKKKKTSFLIVCLFLFCLLRNLASLMPHHQRLITDASSPMPHHRCLITDASSPMPLSTMPLSTMPHHRCLNLFVVCIQLQINRYRVKVINCVVNQSHFPLCVDLLALSLVL